MVAPAVALAFGRTLSGIFGGAASRATAAQRNVTSAILRVMARGFKRLPRVTGIRNPIEPRLVVEKEMDKKFRQLVRFYISRLLDDVARDAATRRKQLMNMVVFGAKARRGSTINTGGTTGLTGTDLFRKVRDPSVIGEMGFPSRFNPEAALVKGLKESVQTIVMRPRYNHLVMKFILDYNRLRRLTPHPAAKMKSGKNITVTSWLDWLHGDAGVTDAGFVPLSKMRGAKPSKRPLSPRSYGAAGQNAGWMISPTKKSTFKKRTSSRGVPKRGSGREKTSINIPGSWRISTPVNKNWVTERSLSIGIGLLDLYAGGLIQRIHRKTVKNFAVKI